MTAPRLDPWSQPPYRPPYNGRHRAPTRVQVVTIAILAALAASVVVLAWAASR